jgi:hypothetical protein
MNFWHFFFQPTTGPWYTGNVWGNMVAWVICGVFAIIWGRRKIIKWDKKRKADDERRHQDMKAHITYEHEKSRKHLENHLAKKHK